MNIGKPIERIGDDYGDRSINAQEYSKLSRRFEEQKKRMRFLA
jgi:hypothetical protein